MTRSSPIRTAALDLRHLPSIIRRLSSPRKAALSMQKYLLEKRPPIAVVMVGLVPTIHLSTCSEDGDGWILGTSPRMTLTFGCWFNIPKTLRRSAER